MGKRLWAVIFLGLVVPPLLLAAQTPVPTATGGVPTPPSPSAGQASPTPAPTAPQAPGPIPAETPGTPTPAITAAEGVPTPLLDQVQEVQKEINALADQRSDTGILYNWVLRKGLEDLLRKQARAAKLSGDKREARELLKDINDLEAAQKSKMDQELALLEKRSNLEKLNLDRLLEYNRQLEEKFQAESDTRKVQELNDGTDYLNQVKGLLDQRLQLDKEFLQARENCDFKDAGEIRKKQEDLNAQIEDLDKRTKEKLQQLENRPIPEFRPNLDDKQNL